MNHAYNITLLISIIGACAWLPEIWKLVRYSRSKLEASVIDIIHIKNFTMTSQNEKLEQKNGQMVVLAVVFFNYHKSFFVRDFQIEITLHRLSVTKILTSDQTLFLIMGLILLCSFLIDTIASFIVFS